MRLDSQKIHFIAIGGSAMHGLAIALQEQGFSITGSDDNIYEPSRTDLTSNNLLPPEAGWFPEKITSDLDGVILGMHAGQDNPELARALELNLPVYSYPEFIYQQCQDKQRIVIAGSHGKSTITAIILHVLKFHNRDFDYLVGAKVNGLENQVKLTDAPTIIIEGDEYYSSAINPTPKFLEYKHHIGLISGISWDHYNVYPSLESYASQFEVFADATPKGGTLIYCEEDDLATVIGGKDREDTNRIIYKTHPNKIKKGVTYLINGKGLYPIKIFGKHNMQNISGALAVLRRFSISDEEFYQAMVSFQGAANRLELIAEKAGTKVYKDFAHSPSKLLATTKALKKQFKNQSLTACIELHTYSSLSKDFLGQYADCFHEADTAVVYYDREVLEQKNREPFSVEYLQRCFNRPDLMVFDNIQKLEDFLVNEDWDSRNLLLMSSGNFSGLDLANLSSEVTGS